MVPYFLLFSFAALFAFRPARHAALANAAARWTMSWQFAFWTLVLMIGFRFEVGGDWGNYLGHLSEATGVPITQAMAENDPAYGALNWIGANWGGVYLVNTACGLLFTWGLLSFCRAQPLPWLAFVVAVPYLVIVVAMGYSRQGVAIGLAMLGLVAIANDKIFRFVACIAAAALFHKSAVILVPLAILAAGRRRIWTILWVAVVSVGLFLLLLQESVESLLDSYIEAEYQSAGAVVRVAMNALPALLFLVFRRRFHLKKNQEKFWTWMALIGLMFVGLLYFSPSSTAVDRIALYWIPIQLFVWSRLPIALDQVLFSKSEWTVLIVIYSISVQVVWLFFAVHSYAWVPYQFYPWVTLWDY